MTVEWHGDAARAHVRSQAAKVLSRCAIIVQRRARELLSTHGTGVSNDQGGVSYSIKGTRKKRIYGAFPSKPGDPPALQTGRLRGSVTVDVDDAALIARVGTNVDYGRHLELGTRRGIAPRPWLRRALAESVGPINRLLAGLNGR